MAKWHVRDGEEFDGAKEEVVIEKEGYLHGKKILEGSDHEESDGDDNATVLPESPSRIPRPAGTCPFSGMSKSSEPAPHSLPIRTAEPATEAPKET